MVLVFFNIFSLFSVSPDVYRVRTNTIPRRGEQFLDCHTFYAFKIIIFLKKKNIGFVTIGWQKKKKKNYVQKKCAFRLFFESEQIHPVILTHSMFKLELQLSRHALFRLYIDNRKLHSP